MTSAVWEQK